MYYGGKMQFEHLMLFSKIASEKSISKVAVENHISQSALSQQMKRLEDEIGFTLFERSNRGIDLTPAGELISKYALQFIVIYKNMRDDLDNLKSNFGTVRIFATNVAAEYALPCSLFKVKIHFPHYSFSLTASRSANVIQQVLNGSADIGFIVGKASDPELICTEAFSDKIYLVTNKNTKAGNDITMDQLYQYPLIMLDKASSSHKLIKEYIVGQGGVMDKLKIMCYLESTESVKSAVINQNGLAFLPYLAIKKELYHKQLRIINLQNFDLNCDIYSIHRSKKEINNPELYSVIEYFITTVNKSIC